MKELYCKDCDSYTSFKPYQSNLYKYKGERVKTCKRCGYLRTQSQRQLPEAEIVHIPSQTKKKER